MTETKEVTVRRWVTTDKGEGKYADVKLPAPLECLTEIETELKRLWAEGEPISAECQLKRWDRRRTDVLTRRLSTIYCRLFSISEPCKFMHPRKPRPQMACVGGCGKMLYPTKNRVEYVYCMSECGGQKWHKRGDASKYCHGMERKEDLVYSVPVRLPPFKRLDWDQDLHKALMESSTRIKELTA